MTVMSVGSCGACAARLRPYWENVRVIRTGIIDIWYWIIFPFTFTLLSNIFLHTWSQTANIIKIFIFLFFHIKPIVLQQDTMIEKLSIFLGCSTVLLGNFLPKFRRKVPPYFSGLWINSQNRNTEEIVGSTFATTERSRERNNPEDLLLYYVTYLQLIKSFRFVSFPVSNASRYLDLRGTE